MSYIPLEILLQIASIDYRVWRAMLAVPEFGRYSITWGARKTVFRIFKTTGPRGETYLNDELNSFFDEPSSWSSDFSVYYWHRRGIVHREDGPARIKYRKHKNVEYWYRDGVLCRAGGFPYKTSVFYCGGCAKDCCVSKCAAKIVLIRRDKKTTRTHIIYP